MGKFISYATSVCLILALCTLATHNTFSQADQSDQVRATADKTDGTPAYVTGLTSGRARSLVGGVVGLISLVMGWRAKGRSVTNPGAARSWSIASLILGLVAIVLSVIHLAGTSGGFGTGGGKAGAIVALVLGLAGMTLSGLTLRAKRS